MTKFYKLRRRIAFWLLDRELMPPDIKDGDWITHPGWQHGPVQVIDMNWALGAVAIKLGQNGGVVIWPMRKNIRKI